MKGDEAASPERGSADGAGQKHHGARPRRQLGQADPLPAPQAEQVQGWGHGVALLAVALQAALEPAGAGCEHVRRGGSHGGWQLQAAG